MRRRITGLLAVTLLGLVACQGESTPEPRVETQPPEPGPTAQAQPPVIAPNVEIEWQRGPSVAADPPDERPPNIIFILADDLGINDITAFGGGVAGGAVPTPSIDAIAENGVMFRQAYAGHGTCAPSRAMIMTGRYPTRTGFEFTPTPPGFGSVVSRLSNEMDSGLPRVIYDEALEANQPPFSSKGLPTEEITIAELLKARGYHTVHIGKWHLGTDNGMAANDQGFDESLLMVGNLFGKEDDPEIVSAKLDFDPIDKFLWSRGRFSTRLNGGELFEPGGYLTDYWTDESLKVIEANRNRPFFLYLAHWGVHTPLQATREDFEAVGELEPYRMRVYAAMVRSLERSVRRIEERLDATGLADNTLIIFSSDNGGAGYIGLPEVNAPYRGWKITFFEGGIRAPIFMKWPNRIAAGTRVDEPVAHIDLMPTIAAAAGAELPDGVEIDGQDLLPVATGTGSLARPDDALFWQTGYTKVVRAGDWKLLLEGRRDKKWLFDLANDPTEQNNLADSQPDKLAALEALLDAHHKNAVGPLWRATRETPIAIDKTRAVRVEPEDEYVYWPN